MLRFKHLIFFGPTGTAKWRGQIYGSPRFSWFINQPDHLSRDFRRRFFPIDLSIAAIGNRQLCEQRRVVRAHPFSLRARNLSADAADRAVSDAWRHALRRAFLYAAGADRAEIRHRAGALARHGARLCPAARARLEPLFHLAAIQAHAARGPWDARENAVTAQRAAAVCAGAITGAKRESSEMRFSNRSSNCSRKRAGAIRPIPAGRNGISRSTAISSGASSSKP